MPTFRQEVAEDDGWSRWIFPHPERYKLACCDCGLVHDMQFRVCADGTIEFRVRTNKRSTSQIRRHKRPKFNRDSLLQGMNESNRHGEFAWEINDEGEGKGEGK